MRSCRNMTGKEENMEREMLTTKEYMSLITENGRYNAYGTFLDRFYHCDDPELRAKMIKDRPVNDELYKVDCAKIAATVEILAEMYDLDVPDWCLDKKYILEEPYYGEVRNEKLKRILKQESPDACRKRNLFLGSNFMSRA